MSRRGAGIIRGLAFEVAPATIFGGASGFCTAAFLAVPPLTTAPVGAGAAAFGCTWLMLRRLGAPRRLHLPQFDVEDFDPPFAEQEEEPEELVLENALRAGSELILEDGLDPAGDELILENPLPVIEEDSRVIRLFDPARMKTAGEMHERIERHLRDSPRPGTPDATQELHEALAALRQSLR